jgi:hypothetical protein
MKKLCVTFAGAAGSSKTPIANYLSGRLNLPVFNNDSLRTEVTEDLGVFNEDEYLKRRDECVRFILKSGFSFIYDASVDRQWKILRQWLEENNYDWFIIGLDLSRDFLVNLYKIKNYDATLFNLDRFIIDHQKFLNEHDQEVGVHISDDQFNNRLNIALEAVRNFIKN